jgi:hypothetical protein
MPCSCHSAKMTLTMWEMKTALGIVMCSSSIYIAFIISISFAVSFFYTKLLMITELVFTRSLLLEWGRAREVGSAFHFSHYCSTVWPNKFNCANFPFTTGI